VNQIPGRYLPVKDEIVWVRWDVLRPHRRAVVTELREWKLNRTAVEFVWLEDDFDHTPKVEAGTYGRVVQPPADSGKVHQDLIQPYAPGELPLIRPEEDWQGDIPSLPADGLLLPARRAAQRLGMEESSFKTYSFASPYHDDFPLAYYQFAHKKLWRASDLDEWRTRHIWPPPKNPNSRSNRNPNGPRAMAAKKRGGPGYGASG
jgi:hypothetical protein